MTELQEQKDALRKVLQAKARQIPSAGRRAADKQFKRAVLLHPKYLEADSVLLYFSTPFEPDTLFMISRALHEGKQVYLPKCVDSHTMLPGRVRSLEDLTETGMFGIREPPEPEKHRVRLDFAVVPCVGASKAGARLGHGAGYYDRFFSWNPDVYKLCLCYKDLLTDDIPVGPLDVMMDEVISF